MTTWREWSKEVRKDPHHTFGLGSHSHMALLNRVRSSHRPLSTVIDGKIERGVSPDQKEAHVVKPKYARKRRLEKAVLRSGASGAQIRKYRTARRDQVVIFTTRDTDIDRYKNVKKHLESYRAQNTCKEVSHKKHPWFSLHRPRKEGLFDSPKIIGLTTTKLIELVFDENQNLVVTDAMYLFRLKGAHRPLACMAVLHSRTFLFFYRVSNQGESRVIPQIKAEKLKVLPYPKAKDDDQKWEKLEELGKKLVECHKDLPPDAGESHSLSRRIQAIEAEAEDVVQSLYGLSAQERTTIDDYFQSV